MCHFLCEASYRPSLVLLQCLLFELYLILLPVFIWIHWGMGWFCFCFLARNRLILKVLWDFHKKRKEKCVCLYKTQFEGPQLSKHLMNSCYLLGTAIDAGFQEQNQTKPMSINKDCKISLCLGTAQEKNYFWIMLNGLFLFIFLVEIRNMPLC